jgi:LacI family transcriptional regulator
LSSVDNLSVGKLRAEGYFKALQNNNIKLNQDLIIRTDSEEDLKEKAEILFNNKTIDGVFALDENDSVAALRISLKKGFSVPENLSIIGFADGILASRRLSPSLTTVSQHGPEIGAAAAELLIERLEKGDIERPYKTTVIKTELRLRESTKTLK